MFIFTWLGYIFFICVYSIIKVKRMINYIINDMREEHQFIYFSDDWRYDVLLNNIRVILDCALLSCILGGIFMDVYILSLLSYLHIVLRMGLNIVNDKYSVTNSMLSDVLLSLAYFILYKYQHAIHMPLIIFYNVVYFYIYIYNQ